MKPQRKAVLLTAVMTAILSVTSFAGAQVTENKTLTLQGAERVIAAAKAEAQRLRAPGGVVAVVDGGGNLMALERLDGTFSAGANISIGKAKTAVMFKKPTRRFEELINSPRQGSHRDDGTRELYSVNRWYSHHGGRPDRWRSWRERRSYSGSG